MQLAKVVDDLFKKWVKKNGFRRGLIPVRSSSLYEAFKSYSENEMGEELNITPHLVGRRLGKLFYKKFKHGKINYYVYLLNKNIPTKPLKPFKKINSLKNIWKNLDV